MLARATTFAIDGLEPRRVWVEVDVRPGLPSFAVVGLADAAVRESRERVRAALLNSGFEFPLRRIVANLAPAHLRKVGPGFDLALALALLAASGQVSAGALDRVAVAGELSLSGELRSVRGILAVAEGARRAGLEQLIVARERAAEAALVEGLRVAGVRSLREAAAILAGAEAPPVPAAVSATAAPSELPDLADVRGQHGPLLALQVAAAGGHNLFFQGAPGTGKTMLARRLPSILPPLEPREALEATRIHSIAGLHGGRGLIRARPFRAPHHTISAAGLVGGGSPPSPGEVTLAHHGVLFLDELPEFPRASLEALRQPLEDGTVAIVRAQRSAVFPARFMLVAASNPCPCGFAGAAGDRCRCSESELARYGRRLSGPLLDRLDLLVPVARPSAAELAAAPTTTSAAALTRVLAARERQRRRLRDARATCNGQLDARGVQRHVALTEAARRALERGYARTGLSARGHHRVLRVAQTLADLDGREHVAVEDVMRALSYRQDAVETDEVAA